MDPVHIGRILYEGNRRIKEKNATILDKGENNIKKQRFVSPKLEGQTSFESVISKWYYVDKTHAIRTLIDFMTSGSTQKVKPSSMMRRDPILITAPRCFGKTTLLENV